MNSEKVKIKAEYLTKKFDFLPTKNSKNKAKSLLETNKNEKEFWALRNISFEIHDGECVGVIGLNGAGKSTLSNIISGQIAPTTGTVEVNGDVSIIAASAGMQGNLSGRENIRLKGLMLGMSNKEINSKMEDIIEFSELGPFIDQPVKTYSSGMKAKLGFSIMVHQEPDIMIIDEGLAVGDKTFVDKSKKKMFEFREQGKTILLVSHSMGTIKEWCDKVIWLNYGEVKAYGTPDEVIPQYVKFIRKFKKLPKKEKSAYKRKQRQKQFTYSIDTLKKEVSAQNDMQNRRNRKKVSSILGSNKDNHNLSKTSKAIVGICILIYLWVGVTTAANVSLLYSLQHPVEFISQKILRNKTNEATQKSEEKESISESQESTIASSSFSSTSSSVSEVSQVQESSTQLSTTPSTETTIYVVKEGDSLDLISEMYGISVESILAVNPDLGEMIHPGQEINLPQN